MYKYVRLLRPKQWIKNAFVFAPLFFAHQFMDPKSWYLAVTASLTFLSISCTVYIFNDMYDMSEDRRHPVKKLRPLAAREVSVFEALLLACAFVAIAIFILFFLPIYCSVIAAIYIALNICYTLYLKRIAILDVFFIAFCYVLRVLMGCYALEVTVSPWIILSTFLLALFLGFGKRYNELSVDDYAKFKPNLQQYSKSLLDRLVTICGGATLITYAIYTAEISHQLGKVEIVYTTAFVAFGLFRYLQYIYVFNEGGEPENILFKDKLQIANITLWLIVTLWLMFLR